MSDSGRQKKSTNKSVPPKKSYSPEERIEILKIYEKNNFSFRKTQAEVKKIKGYCPTHKSIEFWKDKYGDMVLPKDNVATIVEQIALIGSQERQSLMREGYDIMRTSLHKLSGLVENATSIPDVLAVISKMDEIVFRDYMPDQTALNVGEVNFFQQINNKIIERNEKYQSANPQGHREECPGEDS